MKFNLPSYFLLSFFLIILTTSTFVLLPEKARAAACQSNATGNWSAAGTWTNCGGVIPQSADTVQILDTHTVTLNTNSTVRGVTIDLGGILTEDGNSRTLTINNTGGTAHWTNNGTFTKNTE